MLKQPGTKPAHVEWSYCFDVHLNALFPLVLAVYGVQLVAWPCKLSLSLPLILSFSLPVLAGDNIGSLIVANTLWSAGLLYYTYLTFLGYTGLYIPLW